MSLQTSPEKTDTSVYGSALENSMNTTFDSAQNNLSLLTDSDVENVNTTLNRGDSLLISSTSKYETPKLNIKDLTKNILSSEKSPILNDNSLDETTLNTTISTISIDSTFSLNGSSTLSNDSSNIIVISSDEENETSSTLTSLSASPRSVNNSNELDDTKATTNANISSLLTDKDNENKIKMYGSVEEFERNLPETVTMLTTPAGSRVYLVGTAHFSENSQNDVSLVMRNVRPDIVMLELCPSRVHILRYDEKTLLEEAKDINLAKIRNIINTNGVINGLFYILLLNMSAKITKKLGMAPGGEFRRALEEATKIPNCVVQLGDRQINITLQRALRGLSLWQTLKLIPKLLIIDDDISAEEVEQCKKKDLLEELMIEMAGEFPAFGQVFVKERDLYLCNSLQVAALPQRQQDNSFRPVVVVGVVGIGHAAGIARHWGKVDSNKIPEILIIPPASLSNRIFKYTFKYGMLTLCAYGMYKFLRPKIENML